jgi:hypothetical protein
METDALSRRLRFAPPQPIGERIGVQAADIRMFEAINRHGPLPSTYLQRFAGHKDRSAIASRLTKLFNGAKLGLPLLSRPPQQFQSFAARYQHLIYDLTPTSRALLRDRGTVIIERSDAFLHRFMGACVGASIEVTAADMGLRYIARAEVLARRSVPLAISVGSRTLVPDDLFGLQYRDGSYRFFAVEVDRNTESIVRKKGSYSTFDIKLDAYLSIMADETHRTHWGVPNLLVLTITTNETHLGHLVQRVRERAGRYAERFLFKARHEFGVNWRIPDVLTELLRTPWTRTGADFDIARP